MITRIYKRGYTDQPAQEAKTSDKGKIPHLSAALFLSPGGKKKKLIWFFASSIFLSPSCLLGSPRQVLKFWWPRQALLLPSMQAIPSEARTTVPGWRKADKGMGTGHVERAVLFLLAGSISLSSKSCCNQRNKTKVYKLPLKWSNTWQ